MTPILLFLALGIAVGAVPQAVGYELGPPDPTMKTSRIRYRAVGLALQTFGQVLFFRTYLGRLHK